jgi:WD40 repeat protein
MEQEMMAQMGFASFGKAKPKKPAENIQKPKDTINVNLHKDSKSINHDESIIKTNSQENKQHSNQDSEHDSEHDSENDLEDVDRLDELPIQSSCVLYDHSKTITCLSFDNKNSRMVSGARDHKIKLWDFHGMSSTLKSFSAFEPAEGLGCF